MHFKVIIGVDVDTQRDFVDSDGALYVPSKSVVRANIAKLTTDLEFKIGSVDSHAFDAWEFSENGGPFTAHCVKGTEGWLKINESKSNAVRFIPMSQGNLVIGENTAGAGNREYSAANFTSEVLRGVHVIFEKEVYSMFANPNAEKFIAELVEKICTEQNVDKSEILFAVYGYCTGGYCVDAAAEGLATRGYNTAIVLDATAPLDISHEGKPQDGESVSRTSASKNNILILNTSYLLN